MPTILAIDDHPDSLQILALILSKLGYKTRVAETGEAGLAAVASGTPDLIIVDHMMPGMNGVEFIRLCRANPITAATPIILHTAIMDKAFFDDAIHKGANEVWIKGELRLEQMRERLAFYLKDGRGDQIA